METGAQDLVLNFERSPILALPSPSTRMTTLYTIEKQ